MRDNRFANLSDSGFELRVIFIAMLDLHRAIKNNPGSSHTVTLATLPQIGQHELCLEGSSQS